jgi:hypothetical protein
MTIAVRARFDGKVFVPDEPVDLPVGSSGVFLSSSEELPDQEYWEATREEALDALQRLVKRGVKGVNIPDDALRRENLYEDRGL